MNNTIKNLFLSLPVLLLPACQYSGISPGITEQDIPGSWQTATSTGVVGDNWLDELCDGELEQLVSLALENNYQLARIAARVEEAQEAVTVSGAARYPELTLALDGSRRRSVVNDTIGASNSNFELGLDLSWEVDVWGKLNDAEKQSSLNLLAEKARYQDAQHQLAANVARAWYNMIAASRLLTLFRERLENLDVDREIIEAAYRQGLNSALDVYLARATVEQERARIAQQEQLRSENRITLQLLLAAYPDGRLESAATLPVINSAIPTGLPSELLGRRPDLQQAWMNLLASDAGLAVAHKQRFPRLSLVAAGSDVSNELGGLLNGSALAWSLLANLAQPVFNAGRLEALEGQARARLLQAEYQYLEQLYAAFAEVENAIHRNGTLRAQYTATLESEKNAVAALALAREQYQRGLVSYTTVLESQRRAFDAQSTVIDLRNRLLQNRIALYLALGGGFAAGN